MINRAQIEDALRRRESDDALPTALFAAAAVLAGLFLIYFGRGVQTVTDDWVGAITSSGLSLDVALDPATDGHVAVVPVVVLGLVDWVAGDGTVGLRMTANAFFLIAVVTTFLWMRDRAGPWPACLGGIVLVFCGAAWEVAMLPADLGISIAIAVGVGALWALDQGGERDVLACVLLAVGVLSSSVGLVFLIGAGVWACWEPDRARRVFVIVIPLALYAVWWAGWGQGAGVGSLTISDVLSPLAFVVDGIGTSLSSLLGLATPRDETEVSALDWGRPLAVLVIGLVAWRIVRVGRLDRALAATLIMALAFWFIPALHDPAEVTPIGSADAFVGAVLICLVGTELGRAVQIRWRALIAAGVVVAAAALSGAAYFGQAADLQQVDVDAAGSVAVARAHADLADTPQARVAAMTPGSGHRRLSARQQ